VTPVVCPGLVPTDVSHRLRLLSDLGCRRFRREVLVLDIETSSPALVFMEQAGRRVTEQTPW
jgi:hypothetical protein